MTKELREDIEKFCLSLRQSGGMAPCDEYYMVGHMVVDWLTPMLETCEDVASALTSCQGQWIPSVHKNRCIGAIAKVKEQG